MSKFIVLYNYNKYYNRIIKKLSTYAEYKALITPSGNTPAEYQGLEITSTNFDWEDGVFAKHVINIPRGSSSFFNYHEPDYLVLERTYKDGDVNVSEVSRWFVLETTKTRGNQLELSLRRDLLSDYFNEVCSAPVFIEKGNPGINDPAIFNRESMTYNQIKRKELLLNFDKHSGKGNGWIVGYLKQASTPYDILNATGQAEIPQSVESYNDLPQELRNILDSGNLGRIYTGTYKLTSIVNGTAQEYPHPPASSGMRIICDTGGIPAKYGGTVGPYPTSSQLYGYLRFNSNVSSNAIVSIFESRIADIKLIFDNAVQDYYNSLSLSDKVSRSLLNYNGVIYQRNGKYYKINIKYREADENSKTYTVANVTGNSDNLATKIKDFFNLIIYYNPNIVLYNGSANTSYEAATITTYEKKYSFTSEEIEFDKIKASIPQTRNQNLDAPYDLFCIPVKDVSVKSSGSTVLTMAENIAIAIARGIAVAGSSNVLDIQILPYCPFEEILDSEGNIDITGFTEYKDYSYIYKNSGGTDVVCGIIIYPKKCRGTFDMEITNAQAGYNDCLEETSSAIEKKIKSETRVTRFVSPNFASTFEINVQKNKGITQLNVDYFYKPYSPYLHIAPYFSGLYGNDFNDPKGLICSGDFSIATAQSEWENYQIQNKNYELIFNRQIQNLDVNNSIAYDVQKITAGIGQGTSFLTGLAGGAVAGSMVGGPIGTAVGAIAGAVGGAALSGVGAKYDLEYLKKSQTEARSYAVDMYGYNLGNIKAIPYTLTKVSSFTENNKIFPFIEFYDCTDEEKEALQRKIKFNGMTVMRVGQIYSFIGVENRYVQGQLIRLEGVNEDSHVIAEIANEIKLGGYYYGTDTIEP